MKNIAAKLLLFVLAPMPALGATLPGWEFRNVTSELIVPLSTQEQTFENSRLTCAKNDTCDLEKVIFRKENYLIPPTPAVPDDNTVQGTRILAGFLTDEISALTRYLFVQFTRGCMWHSYLDNDMKVETEFGVLRDFLGISYIQHNFPNWVVDTNDTDPAYATNPSQANRHYFLQHGKTIPAWIPSNQGKLFGEERPVIPFGYVTDAVGPAYYSPVFKMAVNASLEFKTCLFKAIDVPLVTNGADVDIDKALVCFSWDSKFVFDHREIVFKSQKGIDRECARPFNVREKRFHLYQLE